MQMTLFELASDPFLTQLIIMVGVFALIWFFFMRPQRKRDKEVQVMRSKLEVGDEVLTRGGIIGRVVSLKDDTVLIETGSDRTKLRIARWAIESNMTGAPDKKT